MSRFRRSIVGCLILAALTLPTFAMAQYDPSKGLVPECSGSTCELCDLVKLANKLIDFIVIYFSWPVAAVLFAYAGYLYITSQGGGQMAQAKAIFLNVAIGFIIVLAAWLVIDAIMGSLVNQSTPFRPWHTIECVGPTGPPPGSGGGGATAIPTALRCTTLGAHYYDGYDPCDPTARANIDYAVANPEGQSIRASLGDGVCSVGRLAPYGTPVTTAVATAANPQINAALVQAIILRESSGNPIAVSPRGAVGLMQLLPTTARSVIPSLGGQSDAAVATWLRDPTNNITAGTAYLNTLVRRYGSMDRALAAYNGGPAANLTSVNCCVGVSGCTVTRSQCLYDNNAHTVLNTGYQETRNYIPWVTSRQAQIASGACP